MTYLNYVLLLSALISIGAAAFCLETKKPAIVPLASAVMTLLILLVSLLSASAPVNSHPSPPFILYAASGEYAWVGSVDRSAPRTYLWRVPNEIQEALQGGAVLVEEGQEEEGEEEHFPYGEWTVSPLGQEGEKR